MATRPRNSCDAGASTIGTGATCRSGCSSDGACRSIRMLRDYCARGSFLAWCLHLTNQMKCLRPIDHSVGNQPLIESGQLALMGASKREQISVSDLGGIQETCWVYMLAVEQGQIVGPESVTGQL